MGGTERGSVLDSFMRNNHLASRELCADGVIPKKLIQDLQCVLGDSIVKKVLANLLKFRVFEEMDTEGNWGVRLKEKMQPSLECLLQQLRCGLELEDDSGCRAAGKYLDLLVEYLQSSLSDISVIDRKKGDCLLKSEGKVYRILLTLSPFWLPLAAEKSPEEKCFIVFGPFASQSWDELYPYYALNEFRSRVALYDPWNGQKLCLCKGSLPVYIDWFYRDQCMRRFSIPAGFCESLHHMGLLRYNDER